MIFFLGTHKPNWLADPRFRNVPLFISRNSIADMKTLPRAITPWALDSGGFTELSLHGRWTVSTRQYVQEVRRIQRDVGNMVWAAPMDWMCEPVITEKTGKSVAEHQRRTVDNFLELRSMAPDVPFIPVLQGWTITDYWRCEEMYARARIDLRREPVVGVGTVCRRQATVEAEKIMRTLASSGLKLHGFGFKTGGIERAGDVLASADSLAWSFAARMSPPLPGHDRPGPGRPDGHQACNNCPDFALLWRKDLMKRLRYMR